jgi:hypothetical protein
MMRAAGFRFQVSGSMGKICNPYPATVFWFLLDLFIGNDEAMLQLEVGL